MAARLHAVTVHVVAVTVALLACGVAIAGDVYQWKDARGVTHYSDAPPPKGQYQSRNVTHRDGETPTVSATPVPVINKNCALAKTNLDRLKTGGDIGLDANGDGKPDAPLDEAERTRLTLLAEANIKSFCTPVAAAPAQP